LVFLLFKGKLIKHANHRMRQDAVDAEACSSNFSFTIACIDVQDRCII